MIASRGWPRIISRTAAVAKGLAIKLHLWGVAEPIPAMIGTPPSKRSMWHGLGPVGVSEAFALRLYELTGCLIADRRNGRLIEPEALSGKKRTAVQELSQVNRRT
jgi:hypothetical protein